MAARYKILILGASYGSLLASKILFGGHSVAFLIPAGIPTPEGNPGHSAVYFLNDGNCNGAVCRANE